MTVIDSNNSAAPTYYYVWAVPSFSAVLVGNNNQPLRVDIDTTMYPVNVNIQGQSGASPLNVGLPGASALGDSMADPTTPLIGSPMMQWDSVNSVWFRGRGNSLSGIYANSPRKQSYSQTSSANSAQTLTIGSPGANKCLVVESITIVRAATAALAGSALLTYTSTNLQGWTMAVGNAMAAGGTAVDVSLSGLRLSASAASTAVSITVPACGAAVTSTIWVSVLVEAA